MGLDLGLEQAGFEVRVAVECNRFAVETIKKNRPDLPVIERKIEDVTTEEILDVAGLKIGDVAIVTGGPSCQPFSTVGQRGSIHDPRGSMFREFLRIVTEARPEFFVMENVRGVLSAAKRHRPLIERGAGHPALEPDEELGSAFNLILKELKATKYHVIFDLLNAADFGVPQVRQRLVFLGSRDGRPLSMPHPTHHEKPAGRQAAWVTLREGLRGLTDTQPQFFPLTATKKKYLKMIPEGKNWRHLPPELQAEALGGAYKSWGGRCGFFRRLGWNKPSPALTTVPDGRATMLCHPSDLRPLSIKEYARLQQFPEDWIFCGGLPQQYRQIGNAVPLGLGHAVGRAIQQSRRKPGQQKLLGMIVCPNEKFLARLAKRPRTIMNPDRMRKRKGQKAAKEWLDGHGRHRHGFLEYLSPNVAGAADPVDVDGESTPRLAS